MTIRIFIADDHRIMRDGLRSMLETIPGFTVVGEASDGRTAVKLAVELKPDVILMDITMPDLNGIEATRQLKSECPDINVIALSIHSDRRFIAGMFRAGANGYLPKDCDFEELNEAILAVCSGHTYLSPVITDQVIKEFISRKISGFDEGIACQLTSREREVLQLLAEGNSTKSIAEHLQVSIKTIETYRGQLLRKTGAHGVAELTKYAIREGLTNL